MLSTLHRAAPAEAATWTGAGGSVVCVGGGRRLGPRAASTSRRESARPLDCLEGSTPQGTPFLGKAPRRNPICLHEEDARSMDRRVLIRLELWLGSETGTPRGRRQGVERDAARGRCGDKRYSQQVESEKDNELCVERRLRFYDVHRHAEPPKPYRTCPHVCGVAKEVGSSWQLFEVVCIASVRQSCRLPRRPVLDHYI